MRFWKGRSESDWNEVMCLLKAEDWVLAFPGGWVVCVGGGGCMLELEERPLLASLLW